MRGRKKEEEVEATAELGSAHREASTEYMFTYRNVTDKMPTDKLTALVLLFLSKLGKTKQGNSQLMHCEYMRETTVQ